MNVANLERKIPQNPVFKKEIFFTLSFVLVTISLSFKNLLLHAYVCSTNPLTPNFRGALPAFFEVLPLNFAVFTAFCSFAFLFRSYGRYVWLLSVDTVVAFFSLRDAIFFREYNAPFSRIYISFAIPFAKTAFSLGGSYAPSAFLSSYDILYFADVLVFLIFFVACMAHKKKMNISPFRVRFKCFIIALLFCLSVMGAVPLLSLFGVATQAYENVYCATNRFDRILNFTPLCYHADNVIGDVFEGIQGGKHLNDKETLQIEEYYRVAHSDVPCGGNTRHGVLDGKI